MSGPPDAMEPGSYRPTDEGLRAAVGDRLAAQRNRDARAIEVEVTDGRVTLHGRVPDLSGKRLADKVSGVVAGITGIENELQVSRGEGEAGR